MTDGPDGGFDQVYREQFHRIAFVAWNVIGDEAIARDVAQEAFVRLHRSWSRVHGYDHLEAWLRRVTVRLAVRAARRRTHEITSVVPDLPTVVPDELRHNVTAALAFLSPRQRAAIVLTYFEDLPSEQVADALGCSPATVRVHLHRGRTRLAELLQEVDDVARREAP